MPRLCDVTVAIVDCEHKTAPLASTGIPSIRTTDIKNGRLLIHQANRISEETYRIWSKRRVPEPGDLILAREAPVGEVGIIPPGHKVCLGQRTVLICPDRRVVDPYYLLYLLVSPPLKHEMTMRAAGSTVAHLNMSDIRELSLPHLPSLQQQRSIASILRSLDDKIDLNRRMSETLEAMARAIFQSWFVDFDPVRAKAEGRQPWGMDAATAALFPTGFDDTGVGDVPRGWAVGTLREVCDFNPTRRLSKNASAPYLDMANMPTNGVRALGWYNRPAGSGVRFTNGDVLLARITPCLENGKTAFVDFLSEGEIGWGSTEFIVMRSKPLLPEEFVYFIARHDAFRTHAIQSMTGTSGRQRVPVGALFDYPVVIPPPNIAEQFGEIVRPLFAEIKVNDSQSETLAALRDTLLPKLMSGEVSMKEAEQKIEEEIA